MVVNKKFFAKKNRSAASRGIAARTPDAAALKQPATLMVATPMVTTPQVTTTPAKDNPTKPVGGGAATAEGGGISAKKNVVMPRSSEVPNRASKLYAKNSADVPKVKIKSPIGKKRNNNANNTNANNKIVKRTQSQEKLLNYVGQTIMQKMLEEEPKSVFERAKEKFLRKIKSMDQFFEDELRKRPDWEKLIHDAEVD